MAQYVKERPRASCSAWLAHMLRVPRTAVRVLDPDVRGQAPRLAAARDNVWLRLATESSMAGTSLPILLDSGAENYEADAVPTST